MSDQFLRDIPEEKQTLSADARAILKALYAFETRMREREESQRAQTTEQIDHLTKAQRELQHSVAQIVTGFPDGNPDGHRRYHEAVIERQKMRSEMFRSTLIKAGSYGGFGLLAWLGYAVWAAFKTEVHK